MPADALPSLVPSPLSELARSASSRQAFESGCSAHHALLIRVGERTGELAGTLAQVFRVGTGASQQMSVLRFQTDMVDAAYFERLALRSVRPRAFEARDLLRWLRHGPCFALPLAKRRGASPFGGRITVGRADNQDIVLRDASVSKLHCWFELAGDTVQLVDAASTNGTVVSGQPLKPRSPAPVLWGDLISVGSVECTLVDPGVFWSAMRECK